MERPFRKGWGKGRCSPGGLDGGDCFKQGETARLLVPGVDEGEVKEMGRERVMGKGNGGGKGTGGGRGEKGGGK